MKIKIDFVGVKRKGHLSLVRAAQSEGERERSEKKGTDDNWNSEKNTNEEKDRTHSLSYEVE